MKSVLVQYNTRLIVALFTVLLVIQVLSYLVQQVQDANLPMSRAIFGVAVFGALALYYQQNNLWQRIAQNQLVLLYCGYVALSFAYGYLRFRTPTASVFDLWLFAFIPAILLIPPFSFRARVLDKALAVGVILSIFSVILALIAFPNTLYDRALFSGYVHELAAIGVGSGYLLLKYAERPNAFTVIGLAGVLTDGITYGIAGAYRGRLILALLLLVLFLILLLRSRRAGSGVKFLAITGAAVAVSITLFLVVNVLTDQLVTVTDRFEGIQERYERTGDLAASDSRLMEMQYFMQLNSNWKLILGHGIGGLWYDYHGMFKEGTVGGFAGARTMLHMNWLHVTFKIGVVGFALLLGILVSHFRKNRVLIRQNWGWWAFVIYYCAWTTYYGDKVLDIRAIIFLIVLIHPWLFRIDSRGTSRPPSRLPAHQRHLLQPALRRSVAYH